MLRLGVGGSGRMIQVPFPPQNLRGFDREGRATPVRWIPEMRITPQWPAQGVVNIYDLQQLVTSYHTGPWLKNLVESSQVRRPFFYPVNGPDGISLTEFGKPHDPTGSHAHHYSLWIAHASVDGHDFWSEKGGMIAHEQFDLMEDGPIFCRLKHTTRWIANGDEVLREKRRITVFKALGDFRVMDIELEYTPARSQAVTFGKTSFGFLAARVAQSMTPFDGGGEIRNSEGDLNESGAHLKHARWIDQSGPVTPDRWGGIAILDHPDNPSSPTVWHCRNDGWAGASFNAERPYTLEAGKTLRLKYRVHLHKGNAREGKVERRFEEYAARPEVAFESPTPRK